MAGVEQKEKERERQPEQMSEENSREYRTVHTQDPYANAVFCVPALASICSHFTVSVCHCDRAKSVRLIVAFVYVWVGVCMGAD